MKKATASALARIMFYEFALLPQLFHKSFVETSELNSERLEGLLQALAGRGLIADLHEGEWMKQVSENIEALSPELRDRLRRLLSHLQSRRRIVQHSRSTKSYPRDERDWLAVALESHQQVKFYAIVSRYETLRDTFDCEKVKTLSEVRTLPALVDRSMDISLQRTARDYRIHLEPALRYAEKLQIIDPHISLQSAYQKKRYFPVIEICAELLCQRRGDWDSGKILIHAGNQTKNNDLVDEAASSWIEALQPLANNFKHVFEVYFWDVPTVKESSGQRFHDRYILFDQEGISTPGGLDVRQKDQSTWTLLSTESCSDIAKRFEINAHTFKLLNPNNKPLVILPKEI